MHEGDKPGFGQHLAQAREAAGLSQEAAARKLRLGSDIVRALEQEDHEKLPAPAYVRGYIRAYAQSLGADAEELVAQYNVHAGGDPELSEFVPAEPYHSRRGPLLLWGSLTVVAVLAVLAGFWAFEHFKLRPLLPELSLPEPRSGERTVPDEPPAAAVDNSEELDAYLAGQAADRREEHSAVEDGLAEEPPSGEPQIVPSDPPAGPSVPGGEPSRSEAPAARPEQPATGTADRQSAEPEPESAEAEPVIVPEGSEEREVVPAAPRGDDRLRVELNGNSWVEVYDANGYQLIYGLFGAGDRRISVRGQAPFQVVLGDARQVDISVNDIAFEIKPYIRWNNTARLTVRPSVQ